MILRYRDHTPQIAESAYLAPDATIIGRVTIGARSSVWFQSVVRADVHWIDIGADCNVQDRCMLHVTTNTWPTILEDKVTVGHSATLHGCTLKAGCLIGMGSTIMDGAVVGEGAMVGAGSLVTPGTIIPPGTLALGSPCRPKRRLTPEEVDHVAAHAERYVRLSRDYMDPKLVGPC